MITYPFERLRLWCGCREFAERADVSTVHLCATHARLGAEGGRWLADARAAVDAYGIQSARECQPFAAGQYIDGVVTWRQ